MIHRKHSSLNDQGPTRSLSKLLRKELKGGCLVGCRGAMELVSFQGCHVAPQF